MTLFKRVFNSHATGVSAFPIPLPNGDEADVDLNFEDEVPLESEEENPGPENPLIDAKPDRGAKPDREAEPAPSCTDNSVPCTSEQSVGEQPAIAAVTDTADERDPDATQDIVARAIKAQNEMEKSQARRIEAQEKLETYAETDAQAAPVEQVAQPAPIDTEQPAPHGDSEGPSAAIATPRPGRSARRVRTRMLGFDTGAEEASDPFANGKTGSTVPEMTHPVGWLAIVSGPGAGHAFSLFNGVSTIGRGSDQTVVLDFGDTSISREKHAAVAYDDESNSFFLGHGGKSNIVRLNGRPVLSTEDLGHGDSVRIGETTLRFVALCGVDFSWEKAANVDA